MSDLAGADIEQMDQPDPDQPLIEIDCCLSKPAASARSPSCRAHRAGVATLMAGWHGDAMSEHLEGVIAGRSMA